LGPDPFGKIIVHEAFHLLGIEQQGRKYQHQGPDGTGVNQGPFAIFGCRVLSCH
jgi:hypothetical protein